MKLLSYERTCNASPSQWDIETDTGPYYARYRHSQFRLDRVLDRLNPFGFRQKETVLRINFPEEDGGYMDDETMLHIIRNAGIYG